MDLELATIDDMVAELERRGLGAVLYVNHLIHQRYEPSPDVPAEDRQKVYATSWISSQPGYKAHALCEGVQRCLDEAINHAKSTTAQRVLCTELSFLVRDVSKRLQSLILEEQKGE